MSLIQFNGMIKMYSVILENVNTSKYNRIKIIFEKEADLLEASLFNGFVELNENNLVKQADYSDIKYVYKKLEDGVTVILTNSKNDVYIKPIAPEPAPEPEPYIPTLEEIKINKINELSSLCKISIISGFDVEINDCTEHFSYDEYDQMNIKEIFDLSMKTKLPMYYHSNGESCKEYSVENIAIIYSTGAMFKMHHVTYFNQLSSLIKNMTSKAEIEYVFYGQELTGTYLQTYQSAMEQAQNNIDTLLVQSKITK